MAKLGLAIHEFDPLGYSSTVSYRSSELGLVEVMSRTRQARGQLLTFFSRVIA